MPMPMEKEKIEPKEEKGDPVPMPTPMPTPMEKPVKPAELGNLQGVLPTIANTGQTSILNERYPRREVCWVLDRNASPGEIRTTHQFLLTEDGRVEDPRVENSARPEFEKPALEAVRRWRFKPGMKDGAAVKTHMRLPMRFRVANS